MVCSDREGAGISSSVGGIKWSQSSYVSTGACNCNLPYRRLPEKTGSEREQYAIDVLRKVFEYI